MNVNRNPTASEHNIGETFFPQHFFIYRRVVDTGDYPLLSNNSSNFRKNSKWYTQGPLGKLIYEKNLKSKISSHALLNRWIWMYVPFAPNCRAIYVQNCTIHVLVRQ
jgi:hypothetical protein